MITGSTVQMSGICNWVYIGIKRGSNLSAVTVVCGGLFGISILKQVICIGLQSTYAVM